MVNILIIVRRIPWSWKYGNNPETRVLAGPLTYNSYTKVTIKYALEPQGYKLKVPHINSINQSNVLSKYHSLSKNCHLKRDQND